MKPIDIASGLQSVLKILEASGFDYMIVGSVAGAIYGEPRLTRALDLVVDIPVLAAVKFPALFSPHEFYVPPQEILSQEITRQGSIKLLHHQSGLKVDFVFRKQNAHSRIEFSRRRRLEILTGLEAWIAAPEDVIIAKLRFYREGQSEKHLHDIRGIIANTPLDRDYLEHWINELDLSKYYLML